MFRLALHWQILIGMIAGTVLGIALNLSASNRSVTVQQGLPEGITRATITDSSQRTEIVYIDADGKETRRVIDPVEPGDNVVPTIAKLAEEDPLAAELYLAHGQSTAKYLGGWFKRLGGLFLRMLQMVAVPLIVTSLLTGIIGLGGSGGVGRMFSRTILYYLATSTLAIVTGLVAVNLIRPGLANQPVAAVADKPHQASSLGEVLFQQLESVIPSNPVSALTEPDFLSIIAFTIAFGLFTIAVGGNVAERIRELSAAGFEVMMAMTTAIIQLAPIGVFFLIAYVTATQGSVYFARLAGTWSQSAWRC